MSSSPVIGPSPVDTLDRDCSPGLWGCSEEIDERAFLQIRTRLALDHGKWDARIGDTETLARFALILPAPAWRQLARLAERLAAEALDAEEELLRDPKAIDCLG